MTDVPAPHDSLALARRIAALAEERRGTDIVLLDVRDLVDYTDFFLIVTGQSARQNQSIGEHVVRTLKGDKRYAISKAGLDTGSWICLDLGDVVAHVFDPETRARYDLELLWSDAPRATLRASEDLVPAGQAAPTAPALPDVPAAPAVPATPATKSLPVAKPKAAPKPKAGPKPKPAAKAKPAGKSKAAPKAKPAAKPKAKPAPKTKAPAKAKPAPKAAKAGAAKQGARGARAKASAAKSSATKRSG
jgi:ribosome-associated protein